MTRTELLNRLDALSTSAGLHDAKVGVERSFLAEIKKHLEGEDQGFDLESHLFEPSRRAPLAAAAAVNMRRAARMVL